MFNQTMVMLQPSSTRVRHLNWVQGLIVGLAGVGILYWEARNPVHSRVTNLMELAGVGAVLASVLMLGWQVRLARWLALITLVGGGGGLWLLPARMVNVASLRMRYVENLKSFEDVPYIWGGESHRGIDCSGLPRQAWREALWSEGLATGNGRLLRAALSHWWMDASARELAKGANGVTVPVYNSEETTAKKAATERLLPGDFAVTADGVHVLVYLNGTDWIEADPEAKKVLLLSSCCDDNPWLGAPVKMYRWRELE